MSRPKSNAQDDVRSYSWTTLSTSSVADLVLICLLDLSASVLIPWVASCKHDPRLFGRLPYKPQGIYLRASRLVHCSLTNDGNAILREIEVAHPAAKSMIELSRTQDEEVGDGTTSVVILGKMPRYTLNDCLMTYMLR